MKKVMTLLTIFTLILSVSYGQEDEILKLKEKIIELQNKGKLNFRNFTLCSKIFGYASYVPLPEPVISKDGSLLVYYEPVNVYTSKRDELYEIMCTQDMALLEENGEVISEWKDILRFQYTTRLPVMDLFAQNSIDLEGKIPPGKYKFKATFKDQLRGESVTKIIDFEIR